ncbi:hypothetical protein ACSBR2_008708 [Camellia fascicularis]
MKLKVKLYDDLHIGALQRVDWLMHKLITELHSSYWLDRYADEIWLRHPAQKALVLHIKGIGSGRDCHG